MYAGHVAVALALKSRSPRVPIAVLTVAAYGPDWVELVLGLLLGRHVAEMYSHCLAGLAIGALVAWGLTALALDREAAMTVALAWLLHWPADFITAYKPLIDPHHVVGLDLYHAPLADFVLEASLVIAACVLYARAYAPTRRQRLWVTAVGVALIGLQGILDLGLSRNRTPTWEPKLAQGQRRPHLAGVPIVYAASSPCMALALSPATYTASAQWQRTVPEESSRWSA